MRFKMLMKISHIYKIFEYNISSVSFQQPNVYTHHMWNRINLRSIGGLHWMIISLIFIMLPTKGMESFIEGCKRSHHITHRANERRVIQKNVNSAIKTWKKMCSNISKSSKCCNNFHFSSYWARSYHNVWSSNGGERVICGTQNIKLNAMWPCSTAPTGGRGRRHRQIHEIYSHKMFKPKQTSKFHSHENANVLGPRWW